MDKPGGLIVDYLGISSDLKKALSFYAESGGNGNPAEQQEDAVNLVLTKLEVIDEMFKGFDYYEYFSADTSRKLSIILEAEEHIFNLENGKNWFMKEVTHLSYAFAIAVPYPEAMAVKEWIALIIDIFDAAGIIKPDKRGEELNLSEYELAFYDALSQNKSAREVMDLDKLHELAIVLVERVRNNITIDWNIKESVRACMKVIVKRLLQQYGYPPDMQALAKETVLEQAKLFMTSEVGNGW